MPMGNNDIGRDHQVPPSMEQGIIRNGKLALSTPTRSLRQISRLWRGYGDGMRGTVKREIVTAGRQGTAHVHKREFKGFTGGGGA